MSGKFLSAIAFIIGYQQHPPSLLCHAVRPRPFAIVASAPQPTRSLICRTERGRVSHSTFPFLSTRLISFHPIRSTTDRPTDRPRVRDRPFNQIDVYCGDPLCHYCRNGTERNAAHNRTPNREPTATVRRDRMPNQTIRDRVARVRLRPSVRPSVHDVPRRMFSPTCYALLSSPLLSSPLLRNQYPSVPM